MNKIELNLKDKKLIYELDLNARQTLGEMGKKLRISKQLVKYKIKKLERWGIIKGYYTLIDSSALGYINFRVYLKFWNIDKQKYDELIRYLVSHKKVWAVVSFSGKWDLVFILSVKEINEFHSYWNNILRSYKQYIRDKLIVVYQPVYHFSRAYILGIPDTSKPRILGEQIEAKHDETDLKILRILSTNARISLVDLAKQLNLSPKVISYRIKQLEKRQVIQGYRPLIDVNTLGYVFYKADITLNSTDRIKQLVSYCHHHPNIYQLNMTIGGADIEIELYVKNINQFLDIMNDTKKQFPGMISDFDYYSILNEHKVTYIVEG